MVEIAGILILPLAAVPAVRETLSVARIHGITLGLYAGMIVWGGVYIWLALLLTFARSALAGGSPIEYANTLAFALIPPLICRYMTGRTALAAGIVAGVVAGLATTMALIFVGRIV